MTYSHTALVLDFPSEIGQHAMLAQNNHGWCLSTNIEIIIQRIPKHLAYGPRHATQYRLEFLGDKESEK